ncbi:MAG: type II toxin-antitoxin system RelE/ParE family toxin [Pseudomonadota bacterium]
MKGKSDRPLAWLKGEVKTPPFSPAARIEAGYLLRQLQAGELLRMPYSRPMPSIGPRCHELRINDENRTWRIIYRIDSDAIVILEVFSKGTAKTPKSIIAVCQRRLRSYDDE